PGMEPNRGIASCLEPVLEGIVCPDDLFLRAFLTKAVLHVVSACDPCAFTADLYWAGAVLELDEVQGVAGDDERVEFSFAGALVGGAGVEEYAPLARHR